LPRGGHRLCLSPGFGAGSIPAAKPRLWWLDVSKQTLVAPRPGQPR
jgi:hypothetical protein